MRPPTLPLSGVTELTTLQCGSCGVWHAIPTTMHASAVEAGGFWTCPNGHRRGYTEGRKAREEVLRERDRLRQKLAERDDTIAKEMSARMKAEAALKSAKSRAARGVCPCCNRTFLNVQKHMRTKHPEAVQAIA